MDPWKECAEWYKCHDAVHEWAALEGKSPDMAADLIARHEEESLNADAPRARTACLLLKLAEVIVHASNTWWHFMRH